MRTHVCEVDEGHGEVGGSMGGALAGLRRGGESLSRDRIDVGGCECGVYKMQGNAGQTVGVNWCWWCIIREVALLDGGQNFEPLGGGARALAS